MGTLAAPTVEGGASFSPVRAMSRGGNYEVIATVAMSNSYATGGDTFTLPGEVSGKDLVSVEVLSRSDLTRWYEWDGSTSAPKIRALTALPNTQVAGSTDLSATTLKVRVIYAG